MAKTNAERLADLRIQRDRLRDQLQGMVTQGEQLQAQIRSVQSEVSACTSNIRLLEEMVKEEDAKKSVKKNGKANA